LLILKLIQNNKMEIKNGSIIIELSNHERKKVYDQLYKIEWDSVDHKELLELYRLLEY